MTPPTHPGDRPSLRIFLTALAVTGALTALVVCAAVAAAPGSVRTPLAWGAGVAAVVLSTAVATAVHARRSARGLRHRLDAVTRDLGRLLQQQARTTDEARQEQQHLIDELARQRTEFTESFAAERAQLEQASEQETDRLRRENARLTGELERARRERAAAVSATSNAAGRMQALATATLADLRAMEDRHSDEDVLADLLRLDHRTAQAGRLADSIAVLTGARSGRRWARPIGMESILRGAMGRIAGYQRVRVHSVSEAAVAGHAAEGVMHALAELLDNAANFSPPSAEVHVYVEEVPAGVIVSVEDSGLVMGDVQLRRAERAVSGDVSELGGLTGTRLGLAVVGRLAAKHGLKVSFRPSARGGTGVLMRIPQDILTTPTPAEPPAATPPAQSPTPAEAPSAAPAAEATPVHEPAAPAPEEGPAGLPKRRRGRTLAEAERSRSGPRTGGTPTTGPDPAKTRAARFSSFRQAVRPTAQDNTATAPTPPAERTASAGRTARSEARSAHSLAPDTDRTAAAPDIERHTAAPALPDAERHTGAPGVPADTAVSGGRTGRTPQDAVQEGSSGTLSPTAPAQAVHPADHPRQHTAPDGRAGLFPATPAVVDVSTAPAGHTPEGGPRDGHAADAPQGTLRDGDAAGTPQGAAPAGPAAVSGSAHAHAPESRPDDSTTDTRPGGFAPDGVSGGRGGVPRGTAGEHPSSTPSHPYAHPEGDTTS
ncbi:ATP-binding protein [Streptomyces sp. CoH27]|uniref:sensor histidine kinase n=1 Tax=Streptomyces sp. CoH27 TaxID=2875763 RepID=UPI001CD330AD|nr:ATP-binding protein [Streptomyces sp. CoH27]